MMVLVTGSRDWTKTGIIRRVIGQSGATHVVHGAARGADAIAGRVAATMGLRVTAVPADWQTHGKSAGPIRNRKMLDMRPDLVLAFHENIETSKGTADCVTEARARGIKVVLITCK